MRNEHQRNQHNISMEILTRKSSWEIVQNPSRPLSSSHTSRPRCRQTIQWWQVVVWWLVVIVIVLNWWCYGFRINKVSCVNLFISLKNKLCCAVVRNVITKPSTNCNAPLSKYCQMCVFSMLSISKKYDFWFLHFLCLVINDHQSRRESSSRTTRKICHHRLLCYGKKYWKLV